MPSRNISPNIWLAVNLNIGTGSTVFSTALEGTWDGHGAQRDDVVPPGKDLQYYMVMYMTTALATLYLFHNNSTRNWGTVSEDPPFVIYSVLSKWEHTTNAAMGIRPSNGINKQAAYLNMAAVLDERPPPDG
ncbi:hypothetical protein DFH07DRAFT_781595 [Mycena maculata]|uniref:Uncharacterized protein n=1 Tax=Mycena maculata TaxID=230809 RepID=A0AAD7MSA5_9AGAR|nr:hypothetical protein DFH07DRAFT_781595 [Mycena maculata]